MSLLPSRRGALTCILAIASAALFGGVASTASAAITTSQTTATQAAQNLAGAGVTVSNATFTGSANALGTFSGGGTGPSAPVGFNSGVILSSGDIANVTGPNNSTSKTTSNGQPGDPDLGPSSLDAAVLEFDFVPNKSSLTFNYVFGSEEYNEYVNSSFNDVFAFYVNGKNCALVPGTTDEVSINNVNNGKNSAFYRDNSSAGSGGQGGPFDTQLDGLTVVLDCPAAVNVNQTNRLKLAIADRGDSALDSDVFIQAGSVTTEPPVQTGRMGGKGALNDTATSSTYSGSSSFAFVLDCTKSKNPATPRQNPLEVRFGSYIYKLTSVSTIGCSTTGAGRPAGFDTMQGSAVGTLKKPNGSTVSATADFRFFDGGAGPNDRSKITITDSTGEILNVDGAPGKFPGSSQPTGENTTATSP